MSHGLPGQNDGLNDLNAQATNGDIFVGVLSADPNDVHQRNQAQVGDEYLNQDISTMPNEASNMAMSLNSEPDGKNAISQSFDSFTNGIDPSIYIDEETQMHTHNAFTTISSPNEVIKSPLDRGDVSSPFSAMESDADGIETGAYDGRSSAPSTRKGSLFGISTPLMSTTTPGASSSGSDPELSSSSRKKRRRTRREMPPAMLSRIEFEPQYLPNIQHSGENFFVPCQINQNGTGLQNQLAAAIVSQVSRGEVTLNNPQQFRTNRGENCFVNPIDNTIKNEPRSDTETMPQTRPITTSGNSLSVTYPASANGCELRIVAQPETQHRARYLTEGSRGPVKDASQQGYPKVELLGCEVTENLLLEVFVGAESGKPVKPHGFYQACKVTGRSTTPCEEIEIEGTKVIQIPFQTGESVLSVDCVGILKLRNADVEARVGVSKAKKRSQTARLVFRVELPGKPGAKPIILQVPSIKINCTQPPGPPEIVRKSCDRCSVEGNIEVFIIGKNFHRGTKVVFQDPEESDGSHWHKEGEIEKESFHQMHMVVKVPPYHDFTIQKPVNVQMLVNYQGRRCEPHSFTYTPLPSTVTASGQSKVDELADSSPMSLTDAPPNSSEESPADARALQNVLDSGTMDNKLVISLLKSLLQSVQGSETGEEQGAGSEIPTSLKKMITSISEKSGSEESVFSETPQNPLPITTHAQQQRIQIPGVSIPPLGSKLRAPPPLIRPALTLPSNTNRPVLAPQGTAFTFGNTGNSTVFNLPYATSVVQQPHIVKSEASSTKPSELWQQPQDGEVSPAKQFLVSPTQVFQTINANDIYPDHNNTFQQNTAGNTFQSPPSNTSNSSRTAPFGGGMSDNSFHDNSANSSINQAENTQTIEPPTYHKSEPQTHILSEGFRQPSVTSSFLQSPEGTTPQPIASVNSVPVDYTQQISGNTFSKPQVRHVTSATAMQQTLAGNTTQSMFSSNVFQNVSAHQNASSNFSIGNTVHNIQTISDNVIQTPVAGTAFSPAKSGQFPQTSNIFVAQKSSVQRNQLAGNVFVQDPGTAVQQSQQTGNTFVQNSSGNSVQQSQQTSNTFMPNFAGNPVQHVNTFAQNSSGNPIQQNQQTGNTFSQNSSGNPVQQNQQTGNTFAQNSSGNPVQQNQQTGNTFAQNSSGNPVQQNQHTGNTFAQNSSGNPVQQNQHTGNTFVQNSSGNSVQQNLQAGNAFTKISPSHPVQAVGNAFAHNCSAHLPQISPSTNTYSITGSTGTFILASSVNSFPHVATGASFQHVVPVSANTLHQNFAKPENSLQQTTITGFTQPTITSNDFISTSGQNFQPQQTFSTSSADMDKPVQLTTTALNSMAYTFKANLTNTTDTNVQQNFQSSTMGQNNNNDNIQQQQRIMQDLQQYHLQPQQELAPVPQDMDVTLSMVHKTDNDSLQKFNNTTISSDTTSNISKQSSIDSDTNDLNRSTRDVTLSQTSDFTNNQMQMFDSQEHNLIVENNNSSFSSNGHFQTNVICHSLQNEQHTTTADMQQHVHSMIVDKGSEPSSDQQQFTTTHFAMETESTHATGQVTGDEGNIHLPTEQNTETSFSMDNLDKLLQTLDGSENFHDISREDVQQHLQ